MVPQSLHTDWKGLTDRRLARRRAAIQQNRAARSEFLQGLLWFMLRGLRHCALPNLIRRYDCKLVFTDRPIRENFRSEEVDCGERRRGRLAPMGSGRAGPKARRRRLPRASRGTPRRTVTAQRARTHPHAWGQRRRYVVQRRATVAAEFGAGRAHAQPVASRRAFRIDALHSPTGQVLHYFPLMTTRNPFPMQPPVFSNRKNHREKLPGFCASALVASREKIQFLVVRLQTGTGREIATPQLNPRPAPLNELLGKKTFALYNLSRLAHNLCFG